MGVIHNKMAIKRLRDGTAAAVADLQDQIDNLDPGGGLSVTVTDITADLETLPEGVTVEFAYLETYGNICTVTFSAENSGASASEVPLYKIPADKVPYTPYSFTANSLDAYIMEGEDGYYIAFEIGESIITTLQWIANPAPAPEPEPGE